MLFEWDAAKAERNLRKHKVAFEDASRVFDDPLLFTEQDRYERGEGRWRTFGSVYGVVLLVVHFDRDDDEVIRIISARKATPSERRRYEQNR